MPEARPETLSLKHGPTPVQWRRSRQARRVSLRIDPRRGVVVLTLPLRAARAAGMALLADHADWVADRLAALPGQVPFAPGAFVPVEGVPHCIRHVPAGRGGAWLEGGELCVAGDATFLSRRTGDFLRAEARRRLGALSLLLAAEAGLHPRRVTVKDTRSRWGSCSADGTLMYSWRLLMAPSHVQHYVVAHEVAHLRHMNHGPQFWALVETLTVHRRAAVSWLQAHGAGLLRIG
ncbi:MAG: M48 family metallopeptidase [Janthinobacterium lividum]